MELSDKIASNAIVRSIGELSSKVDDTQKTIDRIVAISSQTHNSVVVLTGDVARIKDDMRELQNQVKELNGSNRDHEARLQVQETIFEEQVKPCLGRVNDLRVELARIASFGGGFGAIIGIVFAIGKGAGWW